jgi:Translocon-associated protein beta (TRAPB)
VLWLPPPPPQTASDVLLVDGVEAPTNFSLVDGPLTTSLGKIEPGEAATHSYVLLPSTGSFAFEPAAAEVTYIAEIDSKDKQVRLLASTTLAANVCEDSVSVCGAAMLRWHLTASSTFVTTTTAVLAPAAAPRRLRRPAPTPSTL